MDGKESTQRERHALRLALVTTVLSVATLIASVTISSHPPIAWAFAGLWAIVAAVSWRRYSRARSSRH